MLLKKTFDCWTDSHVIEKDALTVGQIHILLKKDVLTVGQIHMLLKNTL
jgi:hypothetical protein